MKCESNCEDQFMEAREGITWYQCRYCFETRYEYLDCPAGQ